MEHYNMKRFIITTLFAYLTFFSSAHEGENHGNAKKPVPGAMKYFSSEALSDKYEVLIKYSELIAGKESTLRLFLSDARTNRAIDSATIAIKVLNQPNLILGLSRIDSGVYQIKGIFPANEIYDLQVNINSSLGPDFLQVSKIEIGKKLVSPDEEEHTHWYNSPWLWAIIGLLLGILLMFLLMRTRYRKITATIFIFGLLIPTASMNPSLAHDGEDHGGGAAKGGG